MNRRCYARTYYQLWGKKNKVTPVNNFLLLENENDKSRF